MRADASGQTLRLSVTELFLADATGLPGGEPAGGVRAWLGRALHARHQRDAEEADPDYRAEHPLSAQLEHEGWQVSIRGRADGLRRRGARVVVEELKSVWPDEPVPTPRLADWHRQLRVYAWLATRELDTPVDAFLVRLPIGQQAGAPEPVSFDPLATEAEIREAVAAWIRQVCDRHEARRAAQGAAGSVRLPFRDWRPGQEALSDAVTRALENREHLLLQAPTGLGKTLAALVPALRFALAHDRRLVFTSATGLGQRTARDALARIAPTGLPVGVRLRARARMCTNDRVLCHELACEAARDHAQAVAQHDLPRALFGEASLLEPDRVLEASRAAGACPFEVSLEAARRLPVTICDLNYVFDPGNRGVLGDDADLEATVLVVDEAHRLAPRVRDALSAWLDAASLERAAEQASFGGAALHGEQARLCRELARRVESCMHDQVGRVEGGVDFETRVEIAPDLLADLEPRLDLLMLATLGYRRATRELAPDDPFLDVWFAVRRFLRSFDDAPRAFGSLAGRTAGSARLRRVCVDPAPWIGPVLARAHAFVGLSATLAPVELHEAELGLARDRASHVTAPDPFPESARCLVIDPSVDTTARARRRATPVLADKLRALSEAVPGSCLALLPSHDHLLEVRAAMGAAGAGVLAQGRDDDEATRLQLLRALEQDRVLVLAVAGGVLAESVDVAAGALSAVAVVGPCLPAPSADRRLLEDHYEAQAGQGFAWAHLAPGMTRVIQAGGRLIRRPSDRGVIALYGRRFLREPYRSALPDAWCGGRPPEDCVGDPAAVARDFFESVAEP